MINDHIQILGNIHVKKRQNLQFLFVCRVDKISKQIFESAVHPFLTLDICQRGEDKFTSVQSVPRGC